MKKIYILGSVASGKSTLAKQLSKELNIPWYELDNIVHHKTETGRYKRTPEQQYEVIEEIDKKGCWIFEGVYRESYHQILDMADKVIFLDTPVWKRKYRIIKRFIRQHLKIEKCEYKSDLKMLKMMFKWTDGFEADRTIFEKRLDVYKEKIEIIKK